MSGHGLRVSDIAPVGERAGDRYRGRVGTNVAGVDSQLGIQMVGTLGDGQVWVYDAGTGTLIPGDVGPGIDLQDDGVSQVRPTTILNFRTGLTADASGNIDATGGSGSGTPGWFNVKDPTYGAVGDGVTADVAAFNAAIAAFNAAGGGVLYIPKPSVAYLITAGLTTITGTGTVLGDGSRADNDGPASLINCSSATAVVFTTTSRHLRFEKLAIVNTASGTVTAGAAIVVASVDGYERTMFNDLLIQWFYDGIDSQGGTDWTMRDVTVFDAWRYAFRIRNLAQPDAGNWLMDHCSALNNGVHHTTAGVRIESSGAGRIAHLEVLGALGFNDYGIDIAAAGNTSVLHVAGASIESYGTDGIRSVGSWPYQTFTGIEFGQYGNGTGHAMNLSGNTDVLIDNIALKANTGTPTAISVSSMTRLAIGQLTNDGFATLYSGTVDQDSTGGVGARVFITGTPSSGDVPIASSGTAAAWGTVGGGLTGFATPAIVLGTAAAAGAATTAIRSDSTVVAFDATTPAAIGTAATGSVAKAARRDHVHATGAGTPSTQALGDAAATGSGPAAAMTDHKHAMPALSSATPLVASGSGATGTALPSSREDHVHPASAAAANSDHEHVMDCLFSGDASTTAWELPAAPVDAYSVAAYVSGVLTEVTLSGSMLTTATFGSAPASGTNNIRFDIDAAIL